MPTAGTTPTMIRFTDEDLAKIERIKAHYGLSTLSAAVRLAIESALREMGEKNRKKIR